MSTIFPLSASVGQVYQGYQFDGSRWNIIGVDLTADYPEIIAGKISASVIPDTFATVEYVDQEISNIDLSSASAAAVSYLVDSAPEALNTLNELAAALGDDENFATTVTTSLSGKLDISSASTTYATKTELQEIDLLPSQTGNDGKYLTTTGASAYWGNLDIPPSAVLQSASPVGAEVGQIWVDSSASASYLNTNDFLLKNDVPYTPVYLMNTGASASRPSPAENGMFRFNTDSEYPEWYDENTSSWWNFYQSKTIEAEYLVIAGGGGGAGAGFQNTRGGGGGAGGYLTGTTTLSPGSSYNVTVGGGGAGGNAGLFSNAYSGSNSSFANIASTGGGAGAAYTDYAAENGGSGGGGATGITSGASGITGQGYNGGSGNSYQNNANTGAGGGGGAGGVGENGNTDGTGYGGDGGVGVSSLITGTSVGRAGGGAGGGGLVAGQATDGGGNSGAGGDPGGNGNPGTANTGGGGGGGNSTGGGQAYAGGAGGSGVVIIAYPDSFNDISSIDGGLTYTLDTSGRPGYKVYTFTAGTGTVII